MAPPDGFEPHFKKSAMTDPWEPLYSKREKERVTIGLTAGKQHCNSRGFVHGGLISTLADNAIGLSCAAHHSDLGGLVTLSLHVDFVSVAKQGDWLEFKTVFVKPGRSVDTAQGQVFANGKVCALVSATFKVMCKTSS
ncbi:MAG: hypothetical protein ACJAY7_001612 [Pseudohongiellaceae bacterium]|jgi:uncharacterized protein (TIGR00369 family)